MPFGKIKARVRESKKGITLVPKKEKKGFSQKVMSVMKKNSELKHYTVNQTTTTIAQGIVYNAVVTGVPMPAAGAQPTDQTRIGDKITITSLHIRARCVINPDPGNRPMSFAVRMVVYQYKPKNGLVLPTLTNLLVNDISGNPGPLSHQAIDWHPDYHILYDSMKVLSNSLVASPGSGVMPDNAAKYWSFFVPIKRATKQLQYDASTTSHSDAIYVAIFTDYTANPGRPTFDMQSRLRFLDG